MAITYEWLIPVIEFVADENGNPTRATTVHWRCHASEGELLVANVGTFTITEEHPGYTTPYGDITKEMAVQWAKDANPEVEANLARQLGQQAAPRTGQGLPWEDQHPLWQAGVAYAVDDMVNHQGTVYRCLQAHTSEPGWTPPAVPALWTTQGATDPNVIPDWVQPTGAQDAYPQGALVCHNLFVWESSVADNVWEPGVSQWTERPDLNCGDPMPT